MTSSELSADTLERIDSSGLDKALLIDRVSEALGEDLAYGPDVTTLATVPVDQVVAAAMTARRPGVLAGLPLALVTLDLVVGPGRWELVECLADGSKLSIGSVAIRVHAPTRELLTAERTMLNFVCHLSGVATLTARWAEAVAPVVVRDTRKTVPGLRVLHKYAVRCGGGVNHRMGLGDAALIKDNHVAAAGSVSAAVAAVRAASPAIPLEVECDGFDQVQEAIAAGVDLILLDNMPQDEMREAVNLAERLGRRGDDHSVRFEASGGLTLDSAPSLSITGVDYAAVGALTHSAPALDLGLDIEEIVGASSEPLDRVGR
ncbi:MAG: carboxylating nicotinate-nucleotide diphosphorylase [Actinomycetes bacterium]